MEFRQVCGQLQARDTTRHRIHIHVTKLWAVPPQIRFSYGHLLSCEGFTAPNLLLESGRLTRERRTRRRAHSPDASSTYAVRCLFLVGEVG